MLEDPVSSRPDGLYWVRTASRDDDVLGPSYTMIWSLPCSISVVNWTVTSPELELSTHAHVDCDANESGDADHIEHGVYFDGGHLKP